MYHTIIGKSVKIICCTKNYWLGYQKQTCIDYMYYIIYTGLVVQNGYKYSIKYNNMKYKIRIWIHFMGK